MSKVAMSSVAVEKLDLGGRIRALRQSRMMSLESLAKKAEVSSGHLSQVERGQSSMTSDKLARIAGVLGVSADRLISGALDVPPAAVQIPDELSQVSEEHALTYAQTMRLFQSRMALVSHKSADAEMFTKADWEHFLDRVVEFLKPAPDVANKT